MSATFQARAGAAAKGLRRQAVVVAVLAILALLLAPVLAHKGGMISLTLFAVICACAALALSALLAFDAALFRVMAGHADEDSSGRAVDAFLAQAELKGAPAETRSLADRLKGASRYAVLQLVAIALAWGALTVGFFSRGAA